MTKNTKPKRTGIAHLVGAARYSFQGLRRLSSETAFRHEAFVACALVSAMIAVRVGLTDFFLGFALLLGIFAAEAMNTAVEEIADLVSPEYSVAVKNAKDLGSLMVALSILAAYGFCGAVIAARLLG
ncbi:diacylglycerol kinase [Rhizobium sp. BK176]|uniref:diacylglycerol kinase n=1 Tax=Rhizobium sp. BK176 TaxID=2587071 RepID=UPI002169F85B|nr:diacylglycerol kinase [Rhizobium sp. BK176]MCS4088538.1 diacylglycerol kinase (ATP) [Rhizobium sp. BK176]